MYKQLFEHEPRVFTFSMHGKNNYPFHKEKSDLDVELLDGCTTQTYLQLLKDSLPNLIDKVQPDFVFYLAGVDILDTDKFGKLKVSIEACKERDAFVFTTVKKHNLPCVVSMGGGYCEDVRIITTAHCNTFKAAKWEWDL